MANPYFTTNDAFAPPKPGKKDISVEELKARYAAPSASPARLYELTFGSGDANVTARRDPPTLPQETRP